MVLVVEVLGVVVARELDHVGAFLRVLVAHVVGAYRWRGIALGVVFQNVLIKALGDVQTVRVDGVVYLVSYAPHYNAGVIAVALYPASDVALGVLCEEAVVVEFGLGLLPHVEGFAVHQQTHLVAELHKLTRRHVVRCAYGVHAHLLHNAELPRQSRFIQRRAERAEVVVHAHSVELHRLAVEQEPSVRVEFRSAVAEGLVYAVQQF